MKRFYISRRAFLATSAAAMAAMTTSSGFAQDDEHNNPATTPGIIPSNTYPETTSSLTVKDPSRFKILQITDSHFFHPKREEGAEMLSRAGVKNRDERTIDDWKRLVDIVRPDMIAHTGDCWHDNPDDRAAEFQAQAIAWIESLGVPFTFVWGNHDQLPDIPKGHDAWHDAKNSLYRGGPGSGNYTVDIMNTDGKRVFELFCINTHRFGLIGTSLDWLKGTVEKRSASGETYPPALLFHHIPTKAYVDALKSASAAGVFLEPVTHNDEDGTAFPLIAALKTVRACFCGHDHVSDISGMMDGIELVFGRSSGWGGYGSETVRKGGKVITVNCESGQYAWESVFSDGMRWQPTPGVVIDKALDAPYLTDPLKGTA